MKKTFITMLALVAGAMVFTACSSDDIFESSNEIPSILKPMTFYASMEEQGGTRTTINGTFIKWENGDKISIFDGIQDEEGSFAHEFILTSDPGSTSGTFTGSAAEGAEVYYALYPYMTSIVKKVALTTDDEVEQELDNHTYFDYWRDCLNGVYGDEGVDRFWSGMNDLGYSSEEGQKIYNYCKTGEFPVIRKYGIQRNGNQFEEVVLPAKQTVAEGQCVDPKAMLMIAKSTDASTLQFKNVCAYVKVTPKFDCAGISLRSTDATKYLAGTMTVDYNEGAPTTTVTANGSNEVLLTGAIKANNTYYIAVRPETLSSGFAIEFLTNDKSHYYARISSKNTVLARNSVTNLGEFTTSGKWSIESPTSGTAADGHTWKLVSPTLKLASESIGPFAYNDKDINVKWGANWELPTKEEMQQIAVNSSWKDNVAIIGIGAIFMDVLSSEINTIKFIWSSETRIVGGVEYRVYHSFGNARSFASSGSENNVLYKYVGE